MKTKRVCYLVCLGRKKKNQSVKSVLFSLTFLSQKTTKCSFVVLGVTLADHTRSRAFLKNLTWFINGSTSKHVRMRTSISSVLWEGAVHNCGAEIINRFCHDAVSSAMHTSAITFLTRCRRTSRPLTSSLGCIFNGVFSFHYCMLCIVMELYTTDSPHSQTKTKFNIYLGNKLTLPGKQQYVSEPEGKPVEQHMKLCWESAPSTIFYIFPFSSLSMVLDTEVNLRYILSLSHFIFFL